jgi:hypothetical protein
MICGSRDHTSSILCHRLKLVIGLVRYGTHYTAEIFCSERGLHQRSTRAVALNLFVLGCPQLVRSAAGYGRHRSNELKRFVRNARNSSYGRLENARPGHVFATVIPGVNILEFCSVALKAPRRTALSLSTS